MNLLNTLFTFVLFSIPAFACTPPEEHKSTIPQIICSNYASEFPGSARADLHFLKELSENKGNRTSSDSETEKNIISSKNTEEAVTRCRRGSSPRHLAIACLTTDTQSKKNFARKLIPIIDQQ